jgi:transcriptional/translational regulatory protein YebC/TACO1
VSDVRHIFSRNNGNLGEAGSVAWMFHQKGYFGFPKGEVTEERLMEAALEAGAEDVTEEDEGFVVLTAPSAFEAVKKTFDDAGLKYQTAELTMLPQTYVPLEGKTAEQMLRLMNALEDSDDVQNVYANFDIPDVVIVAAANS